MGPASKGYVAAGCRGELVTSEEETGDVVSRKACIVGFLSEVRETLCNSTHLTGKEAG